MPSTADWFEWFGGFVPFVLAGIAIFALQLKFRADENKHRYMLLMAVYAATAATYGFLALGEGDYTRPDSVTVIVGRYWLYFATHGFFFAFLALSIVPNYFGALIAGTLATGQQLALLLGARSTGSAIWYAFAWAGVFWLAEGALFILYLRPERDRGDGDADNGEPHTSMRSALSLTMEWLVRVLAIVGGALYLVLYVVDAAWLDLVSTIFQVGVHIGVDIFVKIVIGVLLLWFVKPVLEADVRNFDFGMAMAGTGDDMQRLCGAAVDNGVVLSPNNVVYHKQMAVHAANPNVFGINS